MVLQIQIHHPAIVWLRFAVRMGLFCCALLWSAGSWFWWEAWVTVGLWMVFGVVTTRYLLRDDPALLAERLKLAQVVKIDEERHQQVITTGPYSLVRHPMYTVTIVLLFAMPVALGSRSALLLSLFLILLLIVRTRLEDRTLHAELEGSTTPGKPATA